MALWTRRLSFIFMLLLGAAQGCQRSDYSPSFEAFSRNRLAVLARNVETTREAQQAAADQILETVATIKKDAWTGADPAQAYELAHRLEAASESRVRSAHSRIKVVASNGEDLFRQWARENGEYADKDLKESSRQNRLKVKAGFDAALEEMKKTDAVTPAALAAVRDQVLFLKHHRNAPVVPERPPGSSDPAIPAEALAKQTELAGRRAEEFVASARVPFKP